MPDSPIQTTSPLSHSSPSRATAEARRLRALAGCGILDTPPEPAFDSLAELAAAVCDAAGGFVALVDENRVWFKASHGLELTEVAREDSFCTAAITRRRVLVVEDAWAHERYRDLSLVACPPHVRFYAGAPVAAPGGERVGVVGVLDTRPRKLAPAMRRGLMLLAQQAQGLLELRRLQHHAAGESARLRLVLENSGEAILLTRIDGEISAANPAACALFGCSEDELRGRGRSAFIDPTDERLAAALEERRTGGRFRGELRLCRADGSTFPAEVTSVVFMDEDGALKTSMIIRDLTERQHAEQALRESEERFARLADAAAEAVAIHDNGVILEANQAFHELFGLAPGEAEGASVRKFVRSNSLAPVQPDIGKGVSEVYEATGLALDGRELLLEVRTRPVHVHGRLLGIVALHDVTAERQAEERVRESEELLRQTIAEAHDGFVATDAAGHVVDWNRAAERNLGWARDEILGRKATSTFVPPKHARTFRSVLEEFTRSQVGSAPARAEAEARRKDGSRVPVEYTFWGVEVAGKKLLNAFIHDISDRKQAEEALRASREGLMDLFNSASDLIQLVQPDLRVQYVNPAWLKALGYAGQDVTGLPLLEIVAPEERDAYRTGLEAVLAGTPRAVETTFLARNGARIRVEGFESCRFDDDQPLMIRGFFRDVTQRSQMEEEREELLEAERRAAELLAEQNERLRQLDDMRDEFVSLVSHQVRTPLTSIRGYVELLLDGDAGPLTADQQRFLGFVAEGSKRLLVLADDLLFISRVDAGKLQLSLEDVDVVALARGAIEALHPVADERGVELIQEAEDGMPTVHADAHAVRQAVDNLLSNGVKFTPAGGRVTLRIHARDAYVVMEVADTGIGIPESEQPRLFERFFRASNARTQAIPGTGLGLAIVKEIAEAHGGTLEFETTEGKGSSFRLVLGGTQPVRRMSKAKAPGRRAAARRR